MRPLGGLSFRLQFDRPYKPRAMTSDLCFLSASALLAGYRGGRFTPIDAVSSVLRQIDRVNPSLNAIVTMDADGALAEARASEVRWHDGVPRGALDGVPITIKDNIPVAGMRSTWGSRLYSGFIPTVDELPVARLRSAGTIILGKTNVPEFTLQGYTENPVFGITRNPWDPLLTPGGSSGGAVAAVAGGLGPIALATDGGGSIRRPASHAGLVGLKPSRGRVPRCDGFPVILPEFEVAGAIARTVTDLVLAMEVASAPDARDPGSLPFAASPFRLGESLPAQRILYVPTFADAPVDPEIAAAVAEVARRWSRLGHHVEEMRDFTLSDPINQAWPVISRVGLAWLLAMHPSWQDRVGPSIRAFADGALEIPATEYFEALNTAAVLRHRLGILFTEYDVILTPTTAALPWPAGEPHPKLIAGREVGPRGHAIFTVLANASGCPAISVPCTPAANGLPIGFQLIAPIGGDQVLCALALQYEREHPWADRWPNLAKDI